MQITFRNIRSSALLIILRSMLKLQQLAYSLIRLANEKLHLLEDLSIPWTARRSNHSILKEINPEYSLGRTVTEAEAPILWPPDAKSQLIGTDPDAGKTEGKRRRGWQRMSWLNSITDSMEMNLSKLQETVEDRGAWYATVHEVAKSQTGLTD